MTNINQPRSEKVHQALSRIRPLVSTSNITRQVLERVLEELKSLAAQHELWKDEDFPSVDQVAKQSRYLLWEDQDKSLALYLIVWEPGKTIPPHNHTTWACIAGLSGREENRFYERMDDGSQAGRSALRLDRIVEVGPGDGIAMLAEDIHGVNIIGNVPTRTLHLYGRALEVLTERLSHNLENNSYETKSIGVTSIRALV